MFAPHGEVGPWSATEVAALRLRNSQHAAILRIPSEIVVSIFRQVIKTSPGYQEAVRLITSICYHLRALVFGTPELWGFVSMRGSLGPLFLDRCQWNPISVVPFFMEGDPVGTARIYTCLDRWKNVPNLHLTRVELVEFCGTYKNFEAVSWIFDYHMPNLETLTLASGALMKGSIEPLEEDVETWIVVLSTRRTLKDVHLQQIFVPWGLNIFYGLSTLHLDYRGFTPDASPIPIHLFLEVLSRSPHLETCSLYFAIPPCYNKELLQDTPTRIVNFPFLKELTLFDEPLTVAYLLRHLHFPVATKTLLKLDTPPDQLDGLLSTLFPPNSSIDGATRLSLQQKPIHDIRPALEIGHTTIQYLNDWDEDEALVVESDDIAHTTFTLPLVEAVYRVGPQIRFLKIRIDCGLIIQPEVWKELLEHLPNLEELVYVAEEGWDYQWPAFWSLLCQPGGSGLLCQSLRTLRIFNTRGVPTDSAGCLAMRWKLGRPLEVFQLRIKDSDRSLAQQSISCLRPFVAQLIFEVIDAGERRIVSLTDW